MSRATSIVYEDNVPRTGHIVPYHKINATRSWLKHYDNMLLLKFFAENETDFVLRRRAEYEMQICQRKLDYMQKHINYDKEEALRGAEQLKKIWEQRPKRSK